MKLISGLPRREKVRPLLSSVHFSVDGTILVAWASHRSFRPKDEDPMDDGPKNDDGNDGSDFRGRPRKNDTHESKTDPDTRLYRKANGQEVRLCYLGHILIENRHGLVWMVASPTSPAPPSAKPPRRWRTTVGRAAASAARWVRTRAPIRKPMLPARTPNSRI